MNLGLSLVICPQVLSLVSNHRRVHRPQNPGLVTPGGGQNLRSGHRRDRQPCTQPSSAQEGHRRLASLQALRDGHKMIQQRTLAQSQSQRQQAQTQQRMQRQMGQQEGLGGLGGLGSVEDEVSLSMRSADSNRFNTKNSNSAANVGNVGGNAGGSGLSVGGAPTNSSYVFSDNAYAPITSLRGIATPPVHKRVPSTTIADLPREVFGR